MYDDGNEGALICSTVSKTTPMTAVADGYGVMRDRTAAHVARVDAKFQFRPQAYTSCFYLSCPLAATFEAREDRQGGVDDGICAPEFKDGAT